MAMTNRPDGGPAFGTSVHGGHPGMTLRDIFAAFALAGQMVRSNQNLTTVAERAYEVADLMIAERANP